MINYRINVYMDDTFSLFSRYLETLPHSNIPTENVPSVRLFFSQFRLLSWSDMGNKPIIYRNIKMKPIKVIVSGQFSLPRSAAHGLVIV
jgi:hypothetical protein